MGPRVPSSSTSESPAGEIELPKREGSGFKVQGLGGRPLFGDPSSCNKHAKDYAPIHGNYEMGDPSLGPSTDFLGRHTQRPSQP